MPLPLKEFEDKVVSLEKRRIEKIEKLNKITREKIVLLLNSLSEEDRKAVFARQKEATEAHIKAMKEKQSPIIKPTGFFKKVFH